MWLKNKTVRQVEVICFSPRGDRRLESRPCPGLPARFPQGLDERADLAVCSFFRASSRIEGGCEIPPKTTGLTRINEQIRIPRVRVIDEDGEQLGVLETREALDIARDRGLDLVEVAPNAQPPVCRIMDYGKFKYEESKKAKRARAKQHVQKVKMIKFRPKTDSHDYEFKKNHVVEFLEAGDKVKVVVMFRGREMVHVDFGQRIVERLLDDLQDIALIDDEPRLEGRNLTLMLSPNKKK
jgi:translation initiation factor IF-3